jgi:hypothetical protein
MRSATYELTERGGKRAVARRLAAAFAVAQHAAHEETRVYYDTFDGRLYRAGQDLWVTANGRVKTLSWCAGDTELELPVRSVPESAATLPQGRLREAVAGSTARRRLLPQVAVRRAALRLDLLDGEEKTVARVRIAERSVRDGRGRGAWTEVATVVELEPGALESHSSSRASRGRPRCSRSSRACTCRGRVGCRGS